MSERDAAFRCPDVDRFTDAYVDGEFSDEDRVAVEKHLGECAACARQVRQHAALKTALRASAPHVPAPPSLRTRVTAALDEEEAGGRRRGGRRLAIALLPLAAAASVVGFVWAHATAPSSDSPVVADAIAKYQRDLPIEVTGGDEQVRHWFADKVDFAVRPPRLPHGELVGGRLANVGARQAAYLVYDVNGEKVSVIVFDPAELSIQSARCRHVVDRSVCLDGNRGYHVALYRDNDVGYAVTSSMDEDRMIQLVSTAFAPR